MSKPVPENSREKTDVCLLLEGTYPYVMGGVSQWVHQLMGALDEYTFSLVVILPDRRTEHKVKYMIPDNVRAIEHIYLQDFDLPKGNLPGKIDGDAWEQVESFHRCPINEGKLRNFESIYRNFFNSDTRRYAPGKIADAREAWDILIRIYQERASEHSFVDFFWTFRFIHYPMFRMLVSELPEASLYHTVSTGYAGLLGVIAKLRYGSPLLLTEHGIYTRERRFDICLSDWIFEVETESLKIRKSHCRFKELWNRMFVTLSRFCYEYADCIITLFKANQDYQVRDGSDIKKMRIIPNGIDVESFLQAEHEVKESEDELVVGLMGRVVSIKDAKTFIRACKIVHDEISTMKVYIMGPTDEDRHYFEECQKMVEFLGLEDVVEFTGRINVLDYYPMLDILAVTSISEAQPLVILEANSMGIPVVATDVGACRELLYGRSEEDRALGKSGLIVGVMNSEEVARGIIDIWRSREMRESMAKAGRERVKKYYDKKDLDRQYRELYREHLGESAIEPGI